MNYNRSIDPAAMPDRIAALPVSPTGFPVPWFVTWFRDGAPCTDGEGVPDFRVTGPRKIVEAVKQKRCWICGGPLGVYKAFVIGPMCAINRVISEPPSHRDCAIYSAKVCPFLSRPNMVRNERGLFEDGRLRDGFEAAAGMGLRRNPGAVCVWVTKEFRPFRPHAGNDGILFSIGLPVETLWFAEGRLARRREVMASIDSGYPSLEEQAQLQGPAALAALAAQRQSAMAWVPRAGSARMLDPQQSDIGRKVLYRAGHGVIEEGVIVAFNSEYVFVRYGSDIGSKATRREDVELVVED